MMYDPFFFVLFFFFIRFCGSENQTMAPCVLGEHSTTEIHAPAYSSFCERLTSFCIMNSRLIHVVAGGQNFAPS